ncbi:S1 family peptidase [Pedobacter nyackensis]|uniref:Serine protease Do n=1 Tax=Pedobacter nyackensis TaxID=475255 RepID=A0A1W2CQA7_9SPHI|nr:serine protease [Pedobacter nyackensis]SMC87420.1 serine protease Do [Pedobacter nyackensis]
MKLNRIKHLIALLIGLQFINPAFAQTGDFDPAKLESELKLNSQKAYAACVRIVNLDVNQQAVGGYFSGVVVDAKGHILTAAHAINPNQAYLVSFPDGREFKAKGLGVIHSIDGAMIVITEKGKWPIAEMGYSLTLETNAPCMSISYPGSFAAKKPTIRFGYIGEPKHKTSFMRSTCLMEPGDSGGALFDLKGRVIGIHSRVSFNLDENLEAPIDNFRKYWEALKEPAVHNAFIKEEQFKMNKKFKQQLPVPQMTELIASYKEQDAIYKNNVFTVKDSLNGSVLSTLVNLNGLLLESGLKGKSFFISKSSMVGAKPKIELKDGSMADAKVIARDEANDLVLLQINQEVAGGVNLNTAAVNFGFEQLGTFLISPKPKAEADMSVLGNFHVSIPKSPERYLGIGVSFNNTDNKMLTTGVFPLASEKQEAKPDDIAVYDGLKKINDRMILTTDDLPEELSKFETNQSIKLEYTKNGGATHTKTITLKPRYVKSNPQKDLFVEGKSLRRDNFKEVFVHDARLAPSECGGPVFDAKGNFYGINIARLSRTSSLAIPAPLIVQFVKGITVL